MSDSLIYEASVYTRTVDYRNFKGEEKSLEVYFALDPLQLMSLIAGFEPKRVKSGNPARNGQPAEISGEQQFEFIRDLATRSAGTPSEDGESWEPFEGFADSIAGKAFLTKLASSDGDRREFAQKVVLDPFKAFVGFANQDPSNTDKDKQQFSTMLKQLENVFTVPDASNESIEDRRARLKAEMDALEQTPPAE